MKHLIRQIMLSLALLILSAALAGIPAVVAAPTGGEQGDGRHQKKGMGEKMKQFQKDLGLTESQIQQLKSLKEKHKGERKAHQDAVQEKIKGVLTPDQMALWEKNRESMKPAKGEKPDFEAMKGKRKAFMMELALNETQKKQIQTIMKEERGKQRAAIESDLKSVLTPDQYKKLQDKMKERMQNKGFKNKEGRKGDHIKCDKNKTEKTTIPDKNTKNPLEFEYK